MEIARTSEHRTLSLLSHYKHLRARKFSDCTDGMLRGQGFRWRASRRGAWQAARGDWGRHGNTCPERYRAGVTGYGVTGLFTRGGFFERELDASLDAFPDSPASALAQALEVFPGMSAYERRDLHEQQPVWVVQRTIPVASLFLCVRFPPVAGLLFFTSQWHGVFLSGYAVTT